MWEGLSVWPFWSCWTWLIRLFWLLWLLRLLWVRAKLCDTRPRLGVMPIGFGNKSGATEGLRRVAEDNVGVSESGCKSVHTELLRLAKDPGDP